jgi:hypothetical protein
MATFTPPGMILGTHFQISVTAQNSVKTICLFMVAWTKKYERRSQLMY